MTDDDFAELFRKLPGKSPTGASWQDVAAEFAALGKTFGDVLRSAWEREGDDAGLAGLRDSLQSMLQEVNRTVDGTPEAQQARDQLAQLTDSIRAAAERANEKLPPELVSLLRQANTELRRVTRLDE